MIVTTSHTQHTTVLVAVLYSGFLRPLMVEKLVLQLIAPVLFLGDSGKIQCDITLSMPVILCHKDKNMPPDNPTIKWTQKYKLYKNSS